MIHNFFKKRKLPTELTPEIEVIVSKVKETKDKNEALKLAFDLLSEKYCGGMWGTYIKLHKLFRTDVKKISSKPGYYQCTTLNYLMRIVLVGSGFFEDSDIHQKKSLIWHVSPHQYLRVKINEKEFVNVDLWAKRYGIEFGDYARGFHI